MYATTTRFGWREPGKPQILISFPFFVAEFSRLSCNRHIILRGLSGTALIFARVARDPSRAPRREKTPRRDAVDDLQLGKRNKRGDWARNARIEIAPIYALPPKPIALLKWLPHYFLPWYLLFAASSVAF